MDLSNFPKIARLKTNFLNLPAVSKLITTFSKLKTNFLNLPAVAELITTFSKPPKHLTNIVFWLLIGLWVFLSPKYPDVYHSALVVLEFMYLHEWISIGEGKFILLRLIGLILISLGFWSLYMFDYSSFPNKGVNSGYIMAYLVILIIFRFSKSTLLRVIGGILSVILGISFEYLKYIGIDEYRCMTNVSVLFLLLGPITDAAAYFGGLILGGPKLCPAISPSKTWAGFLSAVVLVPVLIFSATPDHSIWLFNPSINGFFIIPTLCLAAQTGGLMKSWVKRKLGVKDSGAWGDGFLDHVDSVLAIAIAIFVMSHILQ